MDIDQGIRLLREQIEKIPDLASKPPYGPQFKIWNKTTIQTLEAIFDNETVKLYKSASPPRIARSDKQLYQFYQENLENQKQTLIGIIEEQERLAETGISLSKTGQLQKQQPESSQKANNKKVFVVHGRDNVLRDSFFSFLRALGLDPIEWSEAVRMTGQGSPYIGDILDVAFNEAQAIVVLLSPDDEVRLHADLHGENEEADEREIRLQARPNVLFEAGLAFGRNPDRTILVEVGSVKKYSDTVGRHSIRLDGGSEKRNEVANRLETAGCPVRKSGEDWLSVGDFSISRIPANESGFESDPDQAQKKTEAEDIDEEQIEEKIVDAGYIQDAGITDKLVSDGYKMRWSNRDKLRRRIDFEGWSRVVHEIQGKKVVFNRVAKSHDQILIKKRDRKDDIEKSPSTAPSFIEAKSRENKPSTFLEHGEILGKTERDLKSLYVPERQDLFLRLVPSASRNLSDHEAYKLVIEGDLKPLTYGSNGIAKGRNKRGAFVCQRFDSTVDSLTQLFFTGELWGIDTVAISDRGQNEIRMYDLAVIYTKALANYLSFAINKLRLSPPLKIKAGITGIEDYSLLLPVLRELSSAPQQEICGRIIGDTVEYEDIIDRYDQKIFDFLKPFFAYVIEKAGVDEASLNSLKHLEVTVTYALSRN